MLSFAVISNRKENAKGYENIINKVMMKYDFHYNNHCISGNNKSLEEFCKNNSGFLVFVIEDDEDTNSIEIVEKIRKEYGLFSAFIILIDKSNKLNLGELIQTYAFYVHVIKYDKVYELLSFDVKRIINIIYNYKKSFSFYCEKLLYKIPLCDILFVEKELNSKRSMIVCKHKTYTTYKSIVEMQKSLDERFIKSHQSALINKELVESIDLDNNKIIFYNGKECSLVSRKNKKELKKLFTT